jgi:CubicO group peptidase (beta-lactamase class C family)
VYEYTSVNTFALSWLAERVTGLPFAEVLGREIWSAAGFETRACIRGGITGHPDPGGYPARAGGLWLCRTLVLSLFHAVVVPSGLTTRVQPQRWMTI